MKALIALIVAMGVAILVALALVVYGIVSGNKDGPMGFDAREIALPAGCEIAETAVDGGHLVLRLSGLAERGCQAVLIFDLETGAPLGRITGVPGEGAPSQD